MLQNPLAEKKSMLGYDLNFVEQVNGKDIKIYIWV